MGEELSFLRLEAYMPTTRGSNIDQKSITRWTIHRELLPEVERMDRDQLRELLDAIPGDMHDLRKAIANKMG